MWRLQETKHQSKRERGEKKEVLRGGREREKEKKLKKEAKEVCGAIQRGQTSEIWEELERGSLVWQRRGFCIVTI